MKIPLHLPVATGFLVLTLCLSASAQVSTQNVLPSAHSIIPFAVKASPNSNRARAASGTNTTTDDVFVTAGGNGTPSRIEEYTLSGQHVRSIAVPANTGPSAANGTEYLRGIAANDAGQIIGFNGTSSPQLATFFPNTYTFTARTAPGWDISNSGNSGSVGVYGAYSFVLSDNLNNPPADIIRFNPDGTSQQFGAALNNKNDVNLTVGLDGKLYVLYSNPSNGFLVDVYDPTSLALLRTVALQVPASQSGESTSLRNLAVDASGTIYAIDLYNYVYHLDASGSLLQSASHGHGGYTTDIKIDPVTGRILISVSSYGGVILQTDASLSSFTTLIQLDPNQFNENFITFGNAKLAAALNGVTHLLWKNTGGMATVWTVGSDGSVVSTVALANSGMNPNSIADGINGSVQLLWKSPAGAASVWTIAPDGTYTSTPTYGPYGDYQAQALAVGSDNLTRLFWKNSTGASTVWTIKTDGTVASTPVYGPYPSDSAGGMWQAQGMAVGADNQTRLFWKDTQGEASVWTFVPGGTYTATPAFGPYGDWQAQALAVGPDDLTRLLWKNTAGSCTVWTIGLDGIPNSTDPYGPYASASSSTDWQAQAFAVGADGLTRLFWKDAAGSCTVWSVGSDGTPSSTVPYGPYGDWQAIALAAGN